MSKLWIFGDIYGVFLEERADTVVDSWAWIYAVGKELGCTEYKNCSQLGVSNSYIQSMIMQYENNIQSDDYVVVISTSIVRRWFFYDLPQTANFYSNVIFDHYIGKEKSRALTEYITHLRSAHEDALFFHSFLGWLHYKTDKHQWNLIVIPGFEEEQYPVNHKYTVIGSLYNICYNEFISLEDQAWYYRKFSSKFDKRIGHLSKDNHIIMTKKLLNTFRDNTVFDLTTEFRKNFIGEKVASHIFKQQLSSLNDGLTGYQPKF